MTTASAHQQTKGHYWILSIPGVIKIRSSTRVEGADADADADAGAGAGGGIKSIGAKESRGGKVVQPSLTPSPRLTTKLEIDLLKPPSIVPDTPGTLLGRGPSAGIYISAATLYLVPSTFHPR
ncbi:hypothetical protein KQX54_005271 [Cotesia glomerata]|uniref:Uncharacterized protein n=1 Tax=Cotesia glomerata TaxID=32391 RepID=A0AAV7I5Q6_COTGL|nr:hypothetical protein KQX54_005271 [Cotesia glomerata]